MNEKQTRRDILRHTARAAGLLGLGGGALYLSQKAGRADVWQLNPQTCINSKLGATNVEVCQSCATECVVALSAVRAINDHEKCGRCYICPAYFDIMSELDEEWLPSQKLCPRDAIERKSIGEVDEDDPANNYYEYLIDDEKCNGCGKCVMGCKEPAGLGSICLEVRHDVCVDCNRCAISAVCPEDAYFRDLPGEAQKLRGHGHEHA
jgi:Na+-translocating ferredoxin:NAD+ oxidoreductase subunit B